MPRLLTVTSILNKQKKRDSWFLSDYTVNPYEACSFNCFFCYVRGSKYGENMAESLAVKTNALEVLDKQLAARAKKKQFGFVVLASATDPYLEVEKEYKLSRGMLELFLKHRFPVHVITRSPLVERDIDLLQQIDKAAILPNDLKRTFGRGVIVAFSFSTMDEAITNVLESGAPSPTARLKAMQTVSNAGLFCGANLMPLLPFISDTEKEIDSMVERIKLHGGRYALASSMTLFGNSPGDSRTMYFKFLERQFPQHVEATRKLFDAGTSVPWSYQNDLAKSAVMACKKHGIASAIIGTL